MMDLLVIGSGGREHALAWKLAQDSAVGTVYVAPGNAGTATEAKCANVDITVDDFAALAAFAEQKNIACTVVGPEAPLVDGIVNYFAARGLRCFGPVAKAAQLEGSKSALLLFLFISLANVLLLQETATSKNDWLYHLIRCDLWLCNRRIFLWFVVFRH